MKALPQIAFQDLTFSVTKNVPSQKDQSHIVTSKSVLSQYMGGLCNRTDNSGLKDRISDKSNSEKAP